MKAPFPWFGGKSRVAPEVWRLFGNVPNYVEPFGGSVAANVAAWAFANGDNPALRIVLCGYAGEHAPPAGWTEVAWRAGGGYGSQGDGRGRENAARERLWASPHCLAMADLFTQGAT